MSQNKCALTVFTLTMITVGSVDSIRNLPATALFGSQLIALVMIAPGLIALAGVFALLGASMIPFAMGLAFITPFLPTLLILGAMLPLIAGALGFGGEGESEGAGGGVSSDPLLDEIKGLRRDIQSQPVQIVIDDKVVSTMNKKNVRMQSYRDQLK